MFALTEAAASSRAFSRTAGASRPAVCLSSAAPTVSDLVVTRHSGLADDRHQRAGAELSMIRYRPEPGGQATSLDSLPTSEVPLLLRRNPQCSGACPLSEARAPARAFAFPEAPAQ